MKTKLSKVQLYKLGLMTEICCYGMDWAEGDVSQPYTHGAIETVAHQIACCITQWFTNDSTETSWVAQELGLFDFPDRKTLRRRIKSIVLKALKFTAVNQQRKTST